MGMGLPRLGLDPSSLAPTETCSNTVVLSDSEPPSIWASADERVHFQHYLLEMAATYSLSSFSIDSTFMNLPT